jgi:maleate isomerase
MGNSVRLGMITPSVNTCLEPVTVAMIRELPEVSVHFTRFSVPKVTLSYALEEEPMLVAAGLLAEARVHCIAYNATSGALLGLDWDRRLVEQMQHATGIISTTATIAMFDALRHLGIVSIGILFPGSEAVTEKIVSVYKGLGLHCVASGSMGIVENHDMDTLSEKTIVTAIQSVAAPAAEAVVVVGTNLRAAPLVKALEAQLNIPILDSTAATLWQTLRLAGYAKPVIGWGRLLEGR